MPWYPLTLWFVPDQRHAELLMKEGVNPGRIFTAVELQELLGIAGPNGERIRTVAQAKLELAGETAEVLPRHVGAWPDALPGVGHRIVGAFEPCRDCAVGSWVRYGNLVLCLPCALRRAKLISSRRAGGAA